MTINIKEHSSYIYAQQVVNGEKIAPIYVVKQCQQFLDIADTKNKEYFINLKTLSKINDLLSLMIMPTGSKAGQPLNITLIGYQWLFIVAVFCVVHRDNPDKRRYQTAILEIARRQGKTLVVGVCFVLLLLTLPKYSNVYAVAPISRQTNEVRTAVKQIINVSPALQKYFKIRRDYIECLLNNCMFYALTELNNEDKFDSMTVSMFLADEVANLKNAKTLEALKSGGLTVDNPLSCLISTKYNRFDNAFESEIEYAKKVLDGLIDDNKVFGLLFEPDDVENWMQNDDIILQANPLAQENENILKNLFEKRQEAIDKMNSRENFMTKHCNIIYQGGTTETFIDHNLLIKCRAQSPIEWAGRDVYLGLDLSQTTDNTAVSMVGHDKQTDTILIKSLAFIPKGRIDEKTKTEKLDYTRFVNEGTCLACGDLVIDYGFIEDFILNLEEKYKVKIKGIGYDRFNAISTASKLEKSGHSLIEIRQHSSVLHPTIKHLQEAILNQKLVYEPNTLLEINFQNVKCSYDTNLNMYLNKRRSKGKIDMVFR